MGGIADRVKSLFGSKASAQSTLSPFTVAHEKLDEFILDDMKESSKRFGESLSRPVNIEKKDEQGQVVGQETYEQALDLKSDLFFAHHVGSDDVKVQNPDQIRASAQLHREIMRHFTQHPDFLATRPMTRNDEVASALSTMAAQHTLEQELQTTLGEHAVEAQGVANAEDKVRQQEELLRQLREQVKQLRANGDPIPDELKQLIKGSVIDKRSAQQVINEYVQKGGPGGISGAVAGAVAAAAQEAHELTEVYMSLPGVGIGAGQRITPQAAIELAYRWREAPNLKRITELLGKFERDFRYKRAHKIVGGFDEVVGVEVGNDVKRLLPQEFATLSHPILKTKFYRDFAARQLLQYEMIGTAEAGKGDIIICIDSSGSMNGQENDWARAIALAVCSIAHKEKRNVYVIEFASAVTGEWFFPAKGGIDPEVATDFAMSFNGGGTDNTAALHRAKEIYGEHPNFKQADILLLTDGEDYVGEDDLELKQWFTDHGVRIQGICIGMDRSAYTDTVCHDQASVFDFASPSGGTDAIVQGLT